MGNRIDTFPSVWGFVFNSMFTKNKERKIVKEREWKIMNKQESDILNALLLEPFINQRILAEVSGHSLGVGLSCA